MSREDYFFNSNASVVQYETIEISHPDFSQSFFYVRNNANGIVADKGTPAGNETFEFVPMTITDSSEVDDLDFMLEIEFQDLGEVLPAELQAVRQANGLDVKPTLVYRTYRADDLTTPLFGPITLEIQKINFNRFGAVFEASANRANNSQTGEIYTVDRFPMLRAFL